MSSRSPSATGKGSGCGGGGARDLPLHGLGFLGFERWFEQALEAVDEVPFAVIVDGREVGSTRFLAIAPEHRRAEIGWTWLARARGARARTSRRSSSSSSTRSSAAGSRRVEFKTDARNLRSRGALLALGARFEGIFRKHMLLPSGPRDSAWYAITDDDWPAVRTRLEERLDATLTRERLT